MSIEVNGIAHIQMTVNNIEQCMPFWEKLCHFLEMKTLIKNDTTLYCIGSRTGILIREAPEEKKNVSFDQDTSGLHHFCFRARSRGDIDAIYEFVKTELNPTFIHGPEEASHFAPGYYSTMYLARDILAMRAAWVRAARDCQRNTVTKASKGCR